VLSSAGAELARRVDGRRGAVLRVAVLDGDGRAAAERRGDALRVAGLRVAALRVVDRVVLLVVAVLARRVVDGARVTPRDAAPRAICCTCLLRLSRRFKALSTSACFARLRTCSCSWSIAYLSVFWPSLIERSSCRRRSGGTRLSASRRAFLPALTARPTSPDGLDRDDVRFLVAISQPPFKRVGRST
jgi:hypothetical protein